MEIKVITFVIQFIVDKIIINDYPSEIFTLSKSCLSYVLYAFIDHKNLNTLLLNVHFFYSAEFY